MQGESEELEQEDLPDPAELVAVDSDRLDINDIISKALFEQEVAVFDALISGKCDAISALTRNIADTLRKLTDTGHRFTNGLTTTVITSAIHVDYTNDINTHRRKKQAVEYVESYIKRRLVALIRLHKAKKPS